MRRCEHGWHGEELVFMRTTQPWAWATQWTGKTNVSFSSGRTFPSSLEAEQGNYTKTFVLCVLAHAGTLQFTFQHGPFTKRFRPVVTRVPTVVLSISRFSRLAVTRAWLFALNEWITEGTGDLQSLGPRPLRMSWSTCCCCIAVIACGIGLFHMARKQQTNVCTDWHNETILVVRSCSVFTAPPGAYICVFTPSVRYSGSLSTVNETCNKDKGDCKKNVGAHLASPPAH